ncbi:putative peptidoglycan lipid II flippase [Parelusimicrobium proximum]|uniref:lipid II flippase MurJ n=1 Tax=Parelusimicrobium proximum TaxID=3228953 RepID=UPI003D175E46
MGKVSSVLNAVSFKKGAVLSVAFAAVWKVISFLNSIIIAALIGFNTSTDIYFYLIMLTGLGAVILNSINTSVIIPAAMHADKDKRYAFLNVFIIFYISLGFITALLGAVCPGILGLISKFNASDGGLLFGLATIYFALLIIVQFLINILEMEKRFGVALFSPLNALCPLAALIFLSGQFGVAAMLIGFIAAQVLQGIVCIWTMIFKIGWSADIDFAPASGNVFKKNIFSVIMVEGLNLISGFAPLFMISGYSGGVVSALNYSKQIFETPTEVVTYRVAAVSRIEITKSCAKEKKRALDFIFKKNIFTLSLIMIPVAVFTFAYAPEIVKVFFMRGKFGAEEASATSYFVQLFIANIVLWIPMTLNRSLFSADKKMGEFLKYQAPFFLFNLAVVLGAVYIYGPFGYPAGFTFVNILWLVVMYFMLKRYFPQVRYLRSLVSMGKIFLISLTVIVPVYIIFSGVQSTFVRVLSAGVIFVLCFCVFAKVLLGLRAEDFTD